jgi:hypothetical protein
MTSDSASLVPGTTRLFVEISAPALLEVHQDQYGFLRPSPLFFTFERLLELPCSLIVAPPWIGKSFTAGRIDNFLRMEQASTSFRKEALRGFTNLEALRLREPLEPPLWEDWKASDDRLSANIR